MRWPWQIHGRGLRISEYELESRLREAATTAASAARREIRDDVAAQAEARERASDHAAKTAAERVLDRLLRVEGPVFNDLHRRGLLVDLPLTRAGELHEAAFRALVDHELWRLRINALDTRTGRTSPS